MEILEEKWFQKEIPGPYLDSYEVKFLGSWVPKGAFKNKKESFHLANKNTKAEAQTGGVQLSICIAFARSFVTNPLGEQ